MGNPLGGGVSASSTYSGNYRPGRFIKRHRVGTALATAGALLASSVGVAGLASAPAGAADVTTTTSFVAQCRAVSTANVNEPTNTAIYVTGPDEVEAGSNFTLRFQTAPGVLPNTKSVPIIGTATPLVVTRMKIDYQLPANATFVSATVVPKSGDAWGYGSTPDANGNYPGGINVFAGAAATVERIDDANPGAPSASGTNLRLSGGGVIVTSASSTRAAGGITLEKTKKDLTGTLTAGQETIFQLPAIDVTFTASGAVGSTVEPKVRQHITYNSSGDARWYNTSAAQANAGSAGNTWAGTFCRPATTAEGNTPNAGYGALASVAIVEPAPSDVATTTALSVPATAATGATVGISATVSPAPTGGTVNFFADGNPIGSDEVDGSGSAGIETAFDLAGTYAVTAVYGGTTGYLGSDSASSDIVVSDPVVAGPSATVINTSDANPTEGDSITLSAVVIDADTGIPGGPTGTVEFFDGASSLGTQPVDESGNASIVATADGVGGHTYTAVYSGDVNFLGSQGLELVAVSAPGATANPTAGGIVLNANSTNPMAPGPIPMPIPDGSNLASLLTEADGVTSLDGAINFAPAQFEPIPGVLAQTTLGTDGLVTGSVDGSNNATLNIGLLTQLNAISLDGGESWSPMGDDCLLGPIPLTLTGTMSGTNLVDVASTGFEVPPMADAACGGLGGTMNLFLAGNDTTANVNVQLPYTPPVSDGTITGNVTDNLGQPLNLAAVYFLDPVSGATVASVTTSVYGNYTKVVPAGDYKVLVRYKEHYSPIYSGGSSTLAGASIVTVADSGTTTLDASLIAWAKISGTVTEAGSGNPIAGHLVRAFDPDSGDQIGAAVTQADGSYYLPLPIGTYKIQIKGAPSHITLWAGTGGQTKASAEAITYGLGPSTLDAVLTPAT